MKITLLLLGVLAFTCAALPNGLDGESGHPYTKQPRIADAASLNYTKQPRIPEFKLPAIGKFMQFRTAQFNLSTLDRSAKIYLKCSKKTKKVTLGYGEWALFETPNHPDDYPKKTTCNWQFKSEVPIIIECYDFNLEKAKKEKCKKDKLTIDSTQYCGSHDEFYYEGETSVKVQFKSNKKKNYSGFYCYAYGKFITTYAPTSSPSSEFTTGVPPTDDPNSSCTCGLANQGSRIVGGTETEVNEYPWQAAMVYKGTSQVMCGGSVIGSKHILTAAHCTQAVKDYKIKYQILVGAHGLITAASSQLRFNPSNFIQHEDYDDITTDNDISLIVLKGSISFTSSEVRPVCLPTSDSDDYDSVDAIVSGWGALKEGGDQPDVLMEVSVPTMTNTKCQSYYGDEITGNMLCAGFKKGKKDACQGDSGGPLVYNSGSGYTQIGVVSWGYGCAKPKYPGVYARVTEYLAWISTNTASSNKCTAA